MNGRERIFAAIEGRERDHTPFWPFVMAFAAKYAGIPYREFATDYRRLGEAQIRTAEAFDLDVVTMDSDAYREASAFGAVLEFPEDGLPVLKQRAVVDKKSFPMKKPDIGGSKRLVDKIEGVRYLKERCGQDRAVSGWIEAPFQSCGVLCQMDAFLVDVLEEDSFVRELLELVTEFEIEFALEQARAGADIMGIGDAMASLVSAEVYEEQIFPWTKRVVDGIREKSSVKLKYHVCGYSRQILPFVEKLGVDVVNIDYKVDVEEAFALTGGRLAIKGNLDPVAVLKDGTEEQVRAAVREMAPFASRPYILSPGCEVPRDTPWENLRAMSEEAKGLLG